MFAQRTRTSGSEVTEAEADVVPSKEPFQLAIRTPAIGAALLPGLKTTAAPAVLLSFSANAEHDPDVCVGAVRSPGGTAGER